MIAALNIFGLLLTLVGAGIAAKSVIISDDQAKQMGTTRFDENADLIAAVKSQSRHAFWGLVLVAAGSLLQLAALIIPLVN